MSKNITIAEGSQAKNFNTVHKLRTNLIGGGTQYWVPEDEAGAYANMGQKSITSNGTYRASDDSKDGYSQVIVNVPPVTARLTTKTITQNGAYRAVEDNADGYSTVNVNVEGVGETIGLDNEDGNEYVITTDKGEGLIKKVLPTSIRITTPPTKRSYILGETIDTTGMVVTAYKNDGTIWAEDGYSQGIIPASELIIEPTTAMIDANNMYKTDGGGLNVIDISYSKWKFKTQNYDQHGEIIYTECAVWPVIIGYYGAIPRSIGSFNIANVGKRLYLTQYNNMLYGYGIGESCPTIALIQLIPETYTYDYDSTERAYANQWSALNVMKRYLTSISDYIPISSINPLSVGTSSSYYSKGMTLNVKWNRPQDNKTLKTFTSLDVSTR